MKNLLEKLKAVPGWVKAHPGQTAAMVALLLALVVLAVLILPKVISWVAVGLLALWLFYEPTPPVPVDHGHEPFYAMLWNILRRNADIFGVIPPETPKLLAPFWPDLLDKSGVEVIRAEVEKCTESRLTPEQFQRRLQKAVVHELRSGRVVGIPFTSLDNEHPIYFILDVEETDTAYIIDGVYLNTAEKITAVTNILKKRQQLHHEYLNPPNGVPEDDEF